MTTPIETTAWACGTCGKPFRKATALAIDIHGVDHGLKLAEVCCTCRKCGGPSDTYLGTSEALCRKCHREAEKERVTENFERAKRELDTFNENEASRLARAAAPKKTRSRRQ